jgi:hypothetical protein
MAKQVQTVVTFTDDLDPSLKADSTISFTWDGTALEIDLSKKHATDLRKVLKPYLEVARKAKPAAKGATRRTTSAPAATGRSKEELSAIRTWAQANGHAVADRGRIAQAVQDAYDAAQ